MSVPVRPSPALQCTATTPAAPSPIPCQCREHRNLCYAQGHPSLLRLRPLTARPPPAALGTHASQHRVFGFLQREPGPRFWRWKEPSGHHPGGPYGDGRRVVYPSASGASSTAPNSGGGGSHSQLFVLRRTGGSHCGPYPRSGPAPHPALGLFGRQPLSTTLVRPGGCVHWLVGYSLAGWRSRGGAGRRPGSRLHR